MGAFTVAALEDAGHEVSGFDLREGNDVLDRDALVDAADRCDAIVHLAAGADTGTMDEAIDANTEGVHNVFAAAVRNGIGRVVMASSVRALACFPIEGELEYLPLDDDHPSRPRSAYSISKRIMERTAARAAQRHGLTVICLRPPAVFSEEFIAALRDSTDTDESADWSPRRQYGGWIHGTDLGAAFARALVCPAPAPGFAAVLVAADDSNSRLPVRELIRRTCPDVEWRGGPEYVDDPHRSLIISAAGRELLGWAPKIRWRTTIE